MAILRTDAAVWRLDSNLGREADFRSLQEAIDSSAVAPGDILYLAPSTVPYATNTVNLTKRLVIIGPGYFLNQHCDFPVAAPAASLRGTILVSAAGSVISGLDLNRNAVNLQTNSVTVQRCVNLAIWMAGGANCSVLNNFYCNINTPQNTKPTTGHVIKGNQLGQLILLDQGATVANNTISTHSSHFNWGPSYAINNIVWLYDSPGTNGFDANRNFSPSSTETTFVNGSTPDASCHLKAGSPAIGGGMDGTDCGMFGGNRPYVLSGLSSLPTVVAIDAPLSVSDASGLPVTVTVQINP